VLPGAAAAVIAGLLIEPGQIGLEGLDLPQREALEFGALVTVMGDGGIVGAENLRVNGIADDHRHRIAFEQQPERRLALLQLGDVDAQADDPSIAGQPLLDQDAAAVGEDLLMAAIGSLELAQPLLQPLLLAARGFQIVAPRHADPQGILEPGAGREQVCGTTIDFGVFLVPEDVAPLAVEEDNALGQKVDGLAQPFMSALGLGNRSGGFLAHACDFVGRHATAPRRCEFRRGAQAPALGRAGLSIPALDLALVKSTLLQHPSPVREFVELMGQVSEKTVSCRTFPVRLRCNLEDSTSTDLPNCEANAAASIVENDTMSYEI
jgi:hypothetical protein